MSKVSISLSDQTSEWLHEQAGEDISSYVEDLLRRDQARKAAEAELAYMLDEADASGFSEQTIDEIWAEAERAHKAKSA